MDKHKADRIIERALENDLRRRILCWTANRTSPASPKLMSEALDHPLENLSYHVRMLRDARLLAETGQTSVRGSVQHFYRLHPEAANLPQVAHVLKLTG
jgi:DNA-binding transcriptional ArsR family regulator